MKLAPLKQYAIPKTADPVVRLPKVPMNRKPQAPNESALTAPALKARALKAEPMMKLPLKQTEDPFWREKYTAETVYILKKKYLEAQLQKFELDGTELFTMAESMRDISKLPAFLSLCMKTIDAIKEKKIAAIVGAARKITEKPNYQPQPQTNEFLDPAWEDVSKIIECHEKYAETVKRTCVSKVTAHIRRTVNTELNFSRGRWFVLKLGPFWLIILFLLQFLGDYAQQQSAELLVADNADKIMEETEELLTGLPLSGRTQTAVVFMQPERQLEENTDGTQLTKSKERQLVKNEDRLGQLAHLNAYNLKNKDDIYEARFFVDVATALESGKNRVQEMCALRQFANVVNNYGFFARLNPLTNKVPDLVQVIATAGATVICNTDWMRYVPIPIQTQSIFYGASEKSKQAVNKAVNNILMAPNWFEVELARHGGGPEALKLIASSAGMNGEIIKIKVLNQFTRKGVTWHRQKCEAQGCLFVNDVWTDQFNKALNIIGNLGAAYERLADDQLKSVGNAVEKLLNTAFSINTMTVDENGNVDGIIAKLVEYLPTVGESIENVGEILKYIRTLNGNLKYYSWSDMEILSNELKKYNEQKLLDERKKVEWDKSVRKLQARVDIQRDVSINPLAVRPVGNIENILEIDSDDRSNRQWLFDDDLKEIYILRSGEENIYGTEYRWWVPFAWEGGLLKKEKGEYEKAVKNGIKLCDETEQNLLSRFGGVDIEDVVKHAIDQCETKDNALVVQNELLNANACEILSKFNRFCMQGNAAKTLLVSLESTGESMSEDKIKKLTFDRDSFMDKQYLLDFVESVDSGYAKELYKGLSKKIPKTANIDQVVVVLRALQIYRFTVADSTTSSNFLSAEGRKKEGKWSWGKDNEWWDKKVDEVGNKCQKVLNNEITVAEFHKWIDEDVKNLDFGWWAIGLYNEYQLSTTQDDFVQKKKNEFALFSQKMKDNFDLKEYANLYRSVQIKANSNALTRKIFIEVEKNIKKLGLKEKNEKLKESKLLLEEAEKFPRQFDLYAEVWKLHELSKPFITKIVENIEQLKDTYNREAEETFQKFLSKEQNFFSLPTWTEENIENALEAESKNIELKQLTQLTEEDKLRIRELEDEESKTKIVLYLQLTNREIELNTKKTGLFSWLPFSFIV